MAEVSLWLDGYDDIYSDFDSRQYLKRRVSEDFLHELRLELKYIKERVNTLLLLLPGEIRNDNSERAIAENLKEFFTGQWRLFVEKYRRKRQTGLAFGLAGVLMMIINSFISYQSYNSLALTALRVIMEPAGWFILWTAFDYLFYDLKELKKEKQFFRQLAEMKIHFKNA